MPDFTIIEARPYHCGQMARLLRWEQQEVTAKLGLDTHRELRDRFDASGFRRAWMIDGKLAGLGGVVGSRLAYEGFLWLAFTQAATRYKIELVKEMRRQLAIIGLTTRRLSTVVMDGDETAMRFAIFMGFVPYEEKESPAVSRFGRRGMMQIIDSLPRDGAGLAMCCNLEAA